HLNPHDVDHIFGEDVYSWFGAASPDGSNPGYAELSYPWQTFSGASYDYETPPSPGSGLFENNLKHTGYKWMYADNDQDCTTVSSNDPCIPSWRVIQHAVFAEAGAYTAMHSMFLEAQAENGGMLRTGGWIDFGTLQAPLNGYRIPLPGDHPYYDTVAVQTEERPYRGACLGPNSMGLPDASLSGCNASWNSEGVLTKVVPSVSGYRIHRGFGMHVRDSMELHIPVGYVDQGKSYVQTDTANLWHHCTNS
ncbi:hypothetical protein KC717_07125, partial [Candidatus Dojkabacteria bacterium]|nr:hypothetical protein [Candidatus Dojkabacteria bacterium]